MTKDLSESARSRRGGKQTHFVGRVVLFVQMGEEKLTGFPYDQLGEREKRKVKKH